MKSYYSSGKLILTGEYLVLDGALSLALPTQFGQHLHAETIERPKIEWQSLDEHQNIWFETEFDLINNEISSVNSNGSETINRLLQILKAAQQLNPDFFEINIGFKITTVLEFPKNWGLGTSSTLINNIALWTNVDAYKLLEKTFGGSGYDIACAQVMLPLTYQLLNNENRRMVKPVFFKPTFKNQLYFLHLNRKQDSRKGIAQYKKHTRNTEHSISEINEITKRIITCNTIDEFDKLIEMHEQIISKIINQKPIKDQLFKDFNGGVKSLGAWGGDFVLISSKNNPTNYFKSKGFETILRYDEMVKTL